jgi:hypothetical protein
MTIPCLLSRVGNAVSEDAAVVVVALRLRSTVRFSAVRDEVNGVVTIE